MTETYNIQIHKYKDGTISYWCVDTNQYDEVRIADAFLPIMHKGVSSRGDIDVVLSDLKELLEEIDGWV